MDLEPIALAMLALAVASGAAVQAATGFGFAILAAPVFLAVLNSTAAVPILIALHVVQCIVLVPRIWAGVPWPKLGWLGGGALVGCPIGLMLFGLLDVRQMKLAVGAVILVVAGLLASRRRRRVSPAVGGTGSAADDRASGSALVAGALSGAMTAVLVMPGPPLMVHLLRHPLPHDKARALSIVFFAACYVGILAAHVVTGQLDRAGWSVVGWLIVPVGLGTYAGLSLARWFLDRHFAIVLNVLLVLAGVGAIASAL